MELRATITAKGAIFDGQAPEIMNKRLLAAMYKATAYLKRKVKDKTPQGVYDAQGGLRSTIFGEVVQYGASVKGLVGHQSKYGDVIEMGRRPGQKMPPAGALLSWIELKTELSGDAAKGVEYVIRRKIGKEGFEGVHMFENTFEENWQKVEEIFDRAGFDIAKELGAQP